MVGLVPYPHEAELKQNIRIATVDSAGRAYTWALHNPFYKKRKSRPGCLWPYNPYYFQCYKVFADVLDFDDLASERNSLAMYRLVGLSDYKIAIGGKNGNIKIFRFDDFQGMDDLDRFEINKNYYSNLNLI